MTSEISAVIVALIGLAGCTGWWTYKTKKLEIRHDDAGLAKDVAALKESVAAMHQLVEGTADVTRAMAGERICWLGSLYLKRPDGKLTDDEHKNLKAIYDPYHDKLGGNGTAKKVMDDINARMTITMED